MITKSIQIIHRILGTLLSMLFLVWFLSGFVMIYHTFPKVFDMDKRKYAEIIPATELPSIEEVQARIPEGEMIFRLSLDTRQGQPIYHVMTDQGRYDLPAESTQALLPVDGLWIAGQWRTDPVARIDTLYKVDQWIPFSYLKMHFPIYKVHYDDSEKHQIYVSSLTGEVLQYTNKNKRFWAWVGAIPHWVYFTSLRENSANWMTTVIWLSGIGCIMCLAGIIMGVRGYYISYRRKKKSITPYRKFVYKWHHILGFFFGLFVLTFTFSGMMSLANLPKWMVKVHNPALERQAYQPTEILPQKYTLDYRVLTEEYKGQIKSIEWGSFGSTPLYKAVIDNKLVIINAAVNDIQKLALQEHEVQIYLQTVHDEPIRISLMTEYDNYYVGLTNHLPLPVYKAEVDDADKSTYYINPANGSVRYFNKRLKVHRWIYQGLHSFKFKYLAERPILWNILMWTTMIGGTLVSLTGVWLGCRYLNKIRKKIKKNT